MPKYTHSDFSLMAEMIVDAHKSPLGEFAGFIIEGKVRLGKTTYSIKATRDVLMMLNPNLAMKEAYELALQHIHFEIDPFLALVGSKQREIRERLPKIDWTKRIPVVTLDDASLYAGADLYIKDQAMYTAFENTMTTIGSAASSVIITAPRHDALTKCLREYYSYHVVKITKYDAYRREAKIMEWYEGKNRKLKLREVGTDEYTARVPNAIYAKYLAPRLEKGEKAVEEGLAISRGRTMEKAGAETIKEAAEEVLTSPKPKPKKKRRKIPLYTPPVEKPRKSTENVPELPAPPTS